MVLRLQKETPDLAPPRENSGKEGAGNEPAQSASPFQPRQVYRLFKNARQKGIC